jgi:hypothetical protein
MRVASGKVGPSVSQLCNGLDLVTCVRIFSFLSSNLADVYLALKRKRLGSDRA